MKYQPPFGATDPNASYVDRNTAGAVSGSKVPAAALEHHQRELVSLIVKSGLTASANDLNQVSGAVRSLRLNYIVAGGAANAITCTLDPVLARYDDLRVLWIIPAAQNLAGALTININGLGAVPIKVDGADPAAGVLKAGVPAMLVRTSTGYAVASPSMVISTLAEALAGAAGDKVITPVTLAGAVQTGRWNYAVAGGTANALTAAYVPVVTAYAEGMILTLKITAENTGPATLNAGGGAKPIVTARGEPMEAGDLYPGAIMSVVYTGVSWMIVCWVASEVEPARRVQQYAAPGTYTFAAARRAWHWVEVYGGGGGGGCDPAAGAAGEGGGGGGYAGKWILLANGATVTVTVGAAGANNGAGTGSAGGTSSFGGYCSATGGSPGTSSGAAGAGGAGAGGEVNLSGGWGSSGNSVDYVGRGGDCAGPHGGKGSPGTDGVPATWPGGGGNITKFSGNVTGGNPAAGGVIIKW